MNARPGQSSLRRGRVSIPGHIYLVTAGTVGRNRLFDDFYVACRAARCFEDRTVLKQTQVLAWVLMPDHAHWLLQLADLDTLDAAVLRLKSASAREANRALGRQGQLWQRGYHDRALRTDQNLIAAARYLVANPLRAGLASSLADYPFWNAVWLIPETPADFP